MNTGRTLTSTKRTAEPLPATSQVRTMLIGGSLLVSLTLACSEAAEPLPSPAKEDPTGTRSQDLVNADGVGNLAAHAVALNSGGCSGTLLRNNVVLTAAHCVQPSNPPTVFPISQAGAVQFNAGVQASQVAEVRLCQDVPGLCPSSRNQSAQVDVALLLLSAPIPIGGDMEAFRGLYTGSGDDLIGTILFCQGRGGTVCGNNQTSNTNRWARFRVKGQSVNRMRFEGISGPGTVVSDGDSGGGCYTPISITEAPGNQISAVITNYTCPSGSTPGKSRSEPIEIIRPWVRATLGQWAADQIWNFSSASELNDFEVFDAVPSSGGPSDWSITAHVLRQTKNIKGTGSAPAASGSNIIARGQVMANGCVRTKVTSSDDDKAGIIFRYYNEDYYYRFYLYEPSNVRLTKVVDGVESTLARANYNFDWSNGVEMKICGKDGSLRAYVDNNRVLTKQDLTFGDGRVGLYNRLLTDAKYHYFVVIHDGTVYPAY